MTPRNLDHYGHISAQELHGMANAVLQLLNPPDPAMVPEQLAAQLPAPIAARLIFTLGRLAETAELAAIYVEANVAPTTDETAASNQPLFDLVELLKTMRAAQPYQPPRVQAASRIVLPGQKR